MQPRVLPRSPSPSPLLFHPKTTAFPSSVANSTSLVHLRGRSGSRLSPPRGAAEKEETQFEVDREKAREALEKLDQQIQTLSQQESLPKKRASPSFSEPNLDRNLIAGLKTEDMPEISSSYLTYTAVALVILTIFNNIIFNVYIKPSVDGKEQVSKIERVPMRDPTEQQVPQLAD